MGAKPRGKYGIDAPWVPWLWFVIAVITLAFAMLFAWWAVGWWTNLLAWYFGLSTVCYLAGASLFWYASLRGKFVLWGRLLNRVALHDQAKILDLGCGRGAVAIMVASRHPKVSVVGIDLWRTVDQSGNSHDASVHNARLNGVTDRVRFVTGDMTRLPFSDGEFSLVTASLSLHNIPTREGRRMALQEAVRTLAPDGHLIIVDIRKTREYANDLNQLGLKVEGPTALGWQSWWTGPWMAASVVQAAK